MWVGGWVGERERERQREKETYRHTETDTQTEKEKHLLMLLELLFNSRCNFKSRPNAGPDCD